MNTMNATDLQRRMQPILEELLRSLGTEHAMTTQNARTVTLDQTSVGRLSRLDAMQQQAMAQASLVRMDVQRRRVDAALDRIRSGSYGRCCACAEDIGLERLLSDPATPFCLDCQVDRDAERHGSR